MILISKTKNYGEIYFEKRTKTIYKLPYHLPRAEQMKPPCMYGFVTLYLCVIILNAFLSVKYLVVCNIAFALAFLTSALLYERKLTKKAHGGEKYRLNCMERSMLCSVYRLAERDATNLYMTVNRYTSVFFIAFAMAVVLSPFSEDAGKQIAYGVMMLEIGVYFSYYASSGQRKRVLKVINTYLSERTASSEKEA